MQCTSTPEEYVGCSGPPRIVYCNGSTTCSMGTVWSPSAECTGGCKSGRDRGQGWFLCRRRVEGGGGGRPASLHSPLEKKHCAGVWDGSRIGTRLGGTRAAPPPTVSQTGSPGSSREIRGSSVRALARPHHPDRLPRWMGLPEMVLPEMVDVGSLIHCVRPSNKKASRNRLSIGLI